MPKLERLTPAILRRAEASGKAAGWYALCRKGYLPQEIALYTDPVCTGADLIHTIRSYAEARNLPVPVSVARRRGRGQVAPPEDFRAAFRSSVMKTGLALDLTQPMLEFLCACADGVRWDRDFGQSSLVRPSNSIASAHALEKRGLIRRKPFERNWIPPSAEDFKNSHHQLTDAGRIVVELLKCVGVFIEADAAIERKAGKA